MLLRTQGSTFWKPTWGPGSPDSALEASRWSPELCVTGSCCVYTYLCCRCPAPVWSAHHPRSRDGTDLCIKGRTEGLNLGNDPVCVFSVLFCCPHGAMIKMLFLETEEATAQV